jgi:hypothetical protein
MEVGMADEPVQAFMKSNASLVGHFKQMSGRKEDS